MDSTRVGGCVPCLAGILARGVRSVIAEEGFYCCFVGRSCCFIWRGPLCSGADPICSTRP